MINFPDLCIECDAEVELDEPRMCYYTSRGPCGDCPDGMDCFRPVLCEECEALEGEPLSTQEYAY